MDLNELALDVACISEAKGFWDLSEFGRTGMVPAKLALVHSELSEALAEYRVAITPPDPADDEEAAEIPLYDGHGDFQGYALVDDVDYDYLMLRQWHRDNRGYVVSRGTLYMHRDLLGLTKGDGGVVDHINGNPLDNRRENLRAVTKGENAQNRHKHYGSSVYRGVAFDATSGLWRAHATVNRKTYHLGVFDDEGDAAKAAAKFREKHMPFSEEATRIRRVREGKFTEELADVVIRVLDITGFYGLDINQAIKEKVEKNRDRPVKHGKRF